MVYGVRKEPRVGDGDNDCGGQSRGSCLKWPMVDGVYGAGLLWVRFVVGQVWDSLKKALGTSSGRGHGRGFLVGGDAYRAVFVWAGFSGFTGALRGRGSSGPNFSVRGALWAGLLADVALSGRTL